VDPLHWAALERHLLVAQALVSAGAGHQRQRLRLADRPSLGCRARVSSGGPSARERGADVNPSDKTGDILGQSQERWRREVEALLQHGAE
jgi:ankyrin repeat protein